jgi:hypothetical protein
MNRVDSMLDNVMGNLMLESFWEMHCRKIENTTQSMKMRFWIYNRFRQVQMMAQGTQFLGQAVQFVILWQITGSMVSTACWSGVLILVKYSCLHVLIIKQRIKLSVIDAVKLSR